VACCRRPEMKINSVVLAGGGGYRQVALFGGHETREREDRGAYKAMVCV
jgi:hypothetical protein